MDEQLAKDVETRQEDIKHYRELQSVAGSEEFQKFFDLLIKTVANKMIWTFTTGKDGDNVKNWEDFVKIRGEIIARLQPIQEVNGAQAMADYLTQQLNEYYNKNNS